MLNAEGRCCQKTPGLPQFKFSSRYQAWRILSKNQHQSYRLRVSGRQCQQMKRLHAVTGDEMVERELLPEAKKWPASPLFLLGTVSGFLAIVYDLFGENGARWLLTNVDQPTHAWIVSHIPKLIRDLVFEIGISNISITLGCVGWAVCTSLVISDALDERKDIKTAQELPDKSARGSLLGPVNAVRLAAAWGTYWTVGGFRAPGDNMLVHYFKSQFNRMRPSTRYKSFSFPSGHSASVTFIIGMLLFAILPWILEIIDRRLREKDTEARLGILKSPGLQKLARSAVKNGSFLWPFATLSTMSARVLGDVHWVSDTMAGACLGASVVSLFLIIGTVLDRRKLQNS